MKKASEIKYVIYPGYVRSKNDGQNHWITFESLCWLYGLNPKECINGDKGVGKDRYYLREYNLENYIGLSPRYNGDYLEYRKRKEEEYESTRCTRSST